MTFEIVASLTTALAKAKVKAKAGNTEGGSTVLLTSCLTGLESAV